jgi:hypothetical protein
MAKRGRKALVVCKPLACTLFAATDHKLFFSERLPSSLLACANRDFLASLLPSEVILLHQDTGKQPQGEKKVIQHLVKQKGGYSPHEKENLKNEK